MSIRLRSWVISGTYYKKVGGQIASIEVTVERRHGNNGNENGKRRRARPVKATLDDGNWRAVVTAHEAAGNHNHKPKYRALVVFYDPNGEEVWRGETPVLNT
jgi:hypothetical protein